MEYCVHGETEMTPARLVHKVGFLVLVTATLSSGRASAQTDFSGEWAGTLHEDLPHRNDALGGGPEIGDYTGLPINQAARLKADSWDASVNSLRSARPSRLPPPTGHAAAATCGSRKSSMKPHSDSLPS